MKAIEALAFVHKAIINHYGSQENIPEDLTATIEYEGYGDCGGIESISIHPSESDFGVDNEADLLSLVTEIDTAVSPYFGSNVLESVLESILYQLLIEKGFDGWEINDGARGYLNISLAEGKFLSLDHEEFYTDTNTYSYSFE